ncbi:MAG: 4-carboxymuconolactone decarboxylase [Chloroflexota bacterium]|nr:4-carboxymuconolactone decarboxylase [Chloroflexota bacterium]
MSPRIPPIDPEHLDEAQQRVYDAIAGTRGKVAGPFATLLHSPELADRVQELGAFVRYGTALDPRLSELAILVISRAWSCQFEWYAHEPHATAAGLPAAIISAVREGRRPEAMEPDEAAVHDYTSELIEKRGVSDATYDHALRAFGVVGTVDLTVLVGYYALLAMTLNAHQIEPPDGSRPLPDL